MKTNIHFWLHLAHFFLKREMLLPRVIEKIRTHFIVNIYICVCVCVCVCILFFFENHAVNKLMWKKSVEWCRPHSSVRRMRIACWITKATSTLSGFRCKNLFARKRLSVTLYVHCLMLKLRCPDGKVTWAGPVLRSLGWEFSNRS